MAVLLLEIWFDYRRDLVIWSQQSTGFKRRIYKILTLGVTDISPKALEWDEKLGYIITVIGVPSAFLLHGYVGFIFGSIKANPWWSTVMMPVIFLLSAIVSGIALVMFMYMVISRIRKVKIDMACLDEIGKFLFLVLILDFTLESLDQVHRIYEAEESFEILHLLVTGKLTYTLLIFQGLMGTVIPLLILGFFRITLPEEKVRKPLYFLASSLVLFGVFFMRWNVVIGGQLFSKSFLGFTSFKLGMVGLEGFWMALFWMILPFMILSILLWLLPPWKKQLG
jgi:Ni/Fe-hydrogenase subunit HybB-like protein